MRIWSIHPRYLDAKGLVALWRETLLGKNVLENKTKGYRNHPQLLRFRKSEHPLDSINYYLKVVYDEAMIRDYHFDKNKIGCFTNNCREPVTRGQIHYEFNHLLTKLKARDNMRYSIFSKIKEPDLHPFFFITEGEIENWEIIIEHQ